MTNPDSSVTISGFAIRPESDGDAEGIQRVLMAAFGGDEEARLVEALRSNGGLVVSLVACASGEIIGHIGFSPMHTEGQPDQGDLLGLAPVAVHPLWQRRGIGSALIRTGLSECRRRDAAVVFVLGAPEFYTRFGFQPAHAFGLSCVYKAPPDAFQLLPLRDVRGRPTTGLIHYRPEFDSFT